MGYKNPIVCKEIYLPLNYRDIESSDGDRFDYFANDYKKKYGIDLHDVFELSNAGDYPAADDVRFIRFKSNLKVYAVVTEDKSRKNINIVTSDVIRNDLVADITDESETSGQFTFGVNIANGDIAFGFTFYKDGIINSIDDFIINLYEI